MSLKIGKGLENVGFENTSCGLPWWPRERVVISLHTVGGDGGLIPGLGGSHMSWSHLSPCAKTTEPVLSSPGAANYWVHAAAPEACMPYSPCPATREASAMRSLPNITLESSPCLPKLEKPCMHQWRYCTQKERKMCPNLLGVELT